MATWTQILTLKHLNGKNRFLRAAKLRRQLEERSDAKMDRKKILLKAESSASFYPIR